MTSPPRSWLATAPDGTLDGLLSVRPELAALHEPFAATVWEDRLVDPVVLELCRVRIAQLHGDAAEAARRTPEGLAAGCGGELFEALPRWPADPAFTAVQRAALAVAEQFVVDAHGVTDEQVAELVDHLGAGATVAFTAAVGLFDGFTRFRRVLQEE